jgi:hypothetical protein
MNNLAARIKDPIEEPWYILVLNTVYEIVTGFLGLFMIFGDSLRRPTVPSHHVYMPTIHDLRFIEDDLRRQRAWKWAEEYGTNPSRYA